MKLQANSTRQTVPHIYYLFNKEVRRCHKIFVPRYIGVVSQNLGCYGGADFCRTPCSSVEPPTGRAAHQRGWPLCAVCRSWCWTRRLRRWTPIRRREYTTRYGRRSPTVRWSSSRTQCAPFSSATASWSSTPDRYAVHHIAFYAPVTPSYR